MARTYPLGYYQAGRIALVVQIAVRPANSQDRDTVLEFCAHTWEWGDYIEHVWDDWLHNPNGRLFVATVDGQPAGLINMRMLSATEAWLEGLRVAPAYRNHGLARELYLVAQAEAMNRGATVARQTVEAKNTRSRHLSVSNHMRQVGVFSIYIAPPLPGQVPRERTQVATLQDLDDIIDYLNRSSIFPTVGGLYYAGFTAREITAALLEQKIEAGQLYFLRRWEQIDGLALVEPRAEFGQQRLSVGYIDGTAIEAISFIAYDLRWRLSTMALDAVRIYAPDLVLVRDALGGLDFSWDGSVFYTYERELI
jgi:GNAT superfamily N-acetyltransferase